MELERLLCIVRISFGHSVKTGSCLILTKSSGPLFISGHHEGTRTRFALLHSQSIVWCIRQSHEWCKHWPKWSSFRSSVLIGLILPLNFLQLVHGTALLLGLLFVIDLSWLLITSILKTKKRTCWRELQMAVLRMNQAYKYRSI